LSNIVNIRQYYGIFIALIFRRAMRTLRYCAPKSRQRHTMNLNQTITLSPDVISQEVSGETVLLDLESENYFGLDEVGTRIWQLLSETSDLQAVYRTLLDEYEVEEERLQTDLEALLTEIATLGLVTLEAAA
jgi:hypothetical protein